MVKLTSAMYERLVEGFGEKRLRELLEELLDESGHHVHIGVGLYAHVTGSVELRSQGPHLLLSSAHSEYSLLVQTCGDVTFIKLADSSPQY